MKKVFAIYKPDGTLHQHLMISEIKFLKDICSHFKSVRVELIEVTKEQYNQIFGK